MRHLKPVVSRAWAPSTDGDVPSWRVQGHCTNHAKGVPRGHPTCVYKNLSVHLFRSIPNRSRDETVALAMRNKHHIHVIFRLMEQFVELRRAGRPYELVVRARPDEWFDNQLTAGPHEPFTERTPLDSPSLIRSLTSAGVLVVPREWAWGGLNDRFAIGPYQAMRHYANQYVHMQQGWRDTPTLAPQQALNANHCPGWIHPEMFVRCNLVRNGVTFAQIPIGIFTVRNDGRKQVLGHMQEGGLHSCSCIAWPTRLRRSVPEHNYIEKCGKKLDLERIAHDATWNVSAFQGIEWKYFSEKPCRGAKWWRNWIGSGHHEWGMR